MSDVTISSAAIQNGKLTVTGTIVGSDRPSFAIGDPPQPVTPDSCTVANGTYMAVLPVNTATTLTVTEPGGRHAVKNVPAGPLGSEGGHQPP
ncbi:MAG TPA: hypothetical protein VGF55_22995 [Gemmataceae bacterium]|jgi:hypothetical protein